MIFVIITTDHRLSLCRLFSFSIVFSLSFEFDQIQFKGGVRDFWLITKTNTPLPQKGLASIMIAPPHTCVRQRLVL